MIIMSKVETWVAIYRSYRYGQRFPHVLSFYKILEVLSFLSPVTLS